MRSKLILFTAMTAVLLALLVSVTRAGLEQEQPSYLDAAMISNHISYQGYLNDAQGNPLDGVYDFKFELYDAATAGNKVWQQTFNNVSVQAGLVDLVLAVSPEDFHGQALWLAISVDGQRLSPRQELLPVPYALTLRPGANIVGNLGNPALLAHNTGSGAGIQGLSDGAYGVDGRTTDDSEWQAAGVYGHSTHDKTFGVLGESDSGIGVEGAITNPGNNNPAVVGYNEGGGNGVDGYSANAVGVKGTTSSADSSGGVFQNLADDGSGLYAMAGGDAAGDVILGGTAESDDGTLFSDLALPGSDLILVSNDAAVVALDDNADEDGHFVVVNDADEVVMAVNEQGDTTVSGDLSVAGNLYGPACSKNYFSTTGNHHFDVPSVCLDQMCWVILETDATYVGAFGPGLFWPILYIQFTDDNAWVGGPNLNIGGASLSDGYGVNGDGVSNWVVGGGPTQHAGQFTLWDDYGGENSPDQWTLLLQQYPGELSEVTVYACPLGRPAP